MNKISDIIARLEVLRAQRGDLPVWTYGEYGASNPVPISLEDIWVGAAHLVFDTDTLDTLQENDVICVIGGD